MTGRIRLRCEHARPAEHLLDSRSITDGMGRSTPMMGLDGQLPEAEGPVPARTPGTEFSTCQPLVRQAFTTND